MILPIFIHIHDKSDKELQEDMAREARWKKAVEEDDRRRREREERVKREKEAEKERRLKELSDEYDRKREEDPWQYQFMPEGWSIFGQTNITIIHEY